MSVVYAVKEEAHIKGKVRQRKGREFSKVLQETKGRKVEKRSKILKCRKVPTISDLSLVASPTLSSSLFTSP